MRIQIRWVVVGCLLLAATGAVASGTALADHDPDEPHNETVNFSTEESSPINVTYDTDYDNEVTVETSGDGKQWTVPETKTLNDVVVTEEGYAFAGSVVTWDASIDKFQNDAVILRTDADGERTETRTHGWQAPDSLSRALSCPALDELSDRGAEFMEGRIESYTGSPPPAEEHPRCGFDEADKDPQLDDPESYQQSEYREYSDEAITATATDDGGYVFAGRTDSQDPTAVFNRTDSTLWVARTDGNGTEVWNRTIDERAGDIHGVVRTDDGGYLFAGVSAEYGSDISAWLFKLDADGNTEWERGYGGQAEDRAFDLIATSDGEYAVVGETYSYGTSDEQVNDVWLLTVDGQGNEQLNRTYTADSVSTENAYESGYTVTETSDGGFLIGGDTTAYADGSINEDAWLVRTDATGQEQWNRSFGASDSGQSQAEIVRDIVPTHDGGFLFVARAESDEITTLGDAPWLVKVNDSGGQLWNETVERGDRAFPGELRATPDGEYLLTYSLDRFDTDGFESGTQVLKFSDEMERPQTDDSETNDSDSSGTDDSDSSETDDEGSETTEPDPAQTQMDSTETQGSDTGSEPSTPGGSGPGFGIVTAFLAVVVTLVVARRS